MKKAPFASELEQVLSSRQKSSASRPRRSRHKSPSQSPLSVVAPSRSSSSKFERDSASGVDKDTASEPEFHSMNIGQTRLIIAIDYGTTYTGIGFATPDADFADVTMVNVLQSWGDRMGNEVKIPSVISYTRPVSGQDQFGLDLSDDAITMINTKLELDPQDNRIEELDLILQVLDGMDDLNFEHVKASRGYPGYTWKRPEEIVKDYLEKVFKRFQRGTASIDEIKRAVPVDIVITIPVKWSYDAKNATLRAVRDAGFNNKSFPLLNKYYLIQEPEAAALYTAQYLRQQEADNLKEGECFVLCDAGGGTVDVVGYRVKKVRPSLEIEAITTPTGDKCGSSFINARFKAWLPKALGRQNFHSLDTRSREHRVSGHTVEDPKMRELMSNFETLKKAFSSFSNDMHLDLPVPLHKLTYGSAVSQGELTITRENMKSFFDGCIDSVIELIQGQLNQVDKKRLRAKSVFLIGGFSESEFLRTELQHSLGMRKVALRQPDESNVYLMPCICRKLIELRWSAVVRGAVLFAMERHNGQDKMTVWPAPTSFTAVFEESYSKSIHRASDTTSNDPSGQVYAKGQFTWFLQKGDLLSVDAKRTVTKEFVFRFERHESPYIDLPILEYSDDDLPQRYENTHEEFLTAANLRFDLSNKPLETFHRHHNPQTGKQFYELSLTCKQD